VGALLSTTQIECQWRSAMEFSGMLGRQELYFRHLGLGFGERAGCPGGFWEGYWRYG